MIAKHKKEVVGIKLKQFYTMMNTAVMMSKTENGEPENWDLSLASYGQDAGPFVDKYMLPYLKTAKAYYPKKNCIWHCSFKHYELANGVRFSAHGDSQVLFSVVVTPAEKHQAGITYFSFMYHPTRYQSPIMPDIYVEWVDGIPSGFLDISDRKGLLATCNRFPARCAGLIMHDGWQIKDDYPHKF